jgi:TonB family protein
MFVRVTCFAAVLVALAANSAFGQLPKAHLEYAKHVSSLLLKAASYPKAAQATRPEGHVVVQFSVAADGRITSRRILKGSGHPVLDEAALATVDRVGRLPPPPPDMSKNFTQTIQFRRWRLFGLIPL